MTIMNPHYPTKIITKAKDTSKDGVGSSWGQIAVLVILLGPITVAVIAAGMGLYHLYKRFTQKQD